MKAIAGAAHRRPSISLVTVAGALALLTWLELSAAPLKIAVPLIALVMVFVVASRTLLAWRSQLALIVMTILLIPIRLYSLPAQLPFHLEVYRVLVAFVVLAWLTSALIDPRVRLRRSAFDPPLALFGLAVVFSILTNLHRVSGLEAEAVKRLVFFLSFVLAFYMVVSLMRRADDIDFLVRILAGGGAVVAFFALIEWRTGYNVFQHLNSLIPALHRTAFHLPFHRNGRLRVYGSAQHPIALGAALIMLFPLALYRAAAFRQLRWAGASVLLLLGALASGSRTVITMLLAMILVFASARSQSVKRFWPAVIPLLIVVHFALPGTIGSLRSSFFPKGGLITQEAKNHVGHGRLATLGPALHTEFTPNPLFGEGFQTRVTRPDEIVAVPNGPILDDQWLGVLLETGLLGAIALLWLFGRSIRRLVKAAKVEDDERSWLLTSLAASIAAFGVGMFTFDAFDFIQVTFLFFFILGLASAALESHRARRPVARQPRPSRRDWRQSVPANTQVRAPLLAPLFRNAAVRESSAEGERTRRAPWSRRKTAVAWLGGTAALLACGFATLIWTGALLGQPSGDSNPQASPRAAHHALPAMRKSAPALRTVPSAKSTAVAIVPATNRKTASSGTSHLVTFRMRASRGDSWALVRLGSRTGDILYSGVVRQGASVKVRGHRLWARFGALGNLDLLINGKPVRGTHAGTVDAYITAKGVDTYVAPNGGSNTAAAPTGPSVEVAAASRSRSGSSRAAATPPPRAPPAATTTTTTTTPTPIKVIIDRSPPTKTITSPGAITIVINH